MEPTIELGETWQVVGFCVQSVSTVISAAGLRDWPATIDPVPTGGDWAADRIQAAYGPLDTCSESVLLADERCEQLLPPRPRRNVRTHPTITQGGPQWRTMEQGL